MTEIKSECIVCGDDSYGMLFSEANEPMCSSCWDELYGNEGPEEPDCYVCMCCGHVQAHPGINMRCEKCYGAVDEHYF